MRERLRSARLTAAGVAVLLLLNYPLLTIVDRPVRVAGVPLLWAYLFTVWAALIVLLAVVVRDRD
jgi:hypothetical protein